MMGLIGKSKVSSCVPILKSLFLAIAKILKGNPKFLGATQTRVTPTSVSRFDFIIGLGKSKLFTKFEVVSFSHYRNIKRDPQ